MADFKGKTVVCIASGPSLTTEDCEAVKQSGLPTIAINNSWIAAPFCDVLYASDYRWWAEYKRTVNITPEFWTNDENAARSYGLNHFPKRVNDHHSGLMAVMFAEWLGASKVVLLGFDCRATLKTHWHEDHAHLANPKPQRLQAFVDQFNRYAPTARARIVNCTPKSALKCFPFSNLEDELCLRHSLEETPPKMNSNCVPSSPC